MLLLTDRATDLLREIQAHQEESEKVLRLVNQGGQFELTFDSPQEEDQIFMSQGANVLLVAQDVAEILADAVIDAQDTPEGPRLTLSSQAT